MNWRDPIHGLVEGFWAVDGWIVDHVFQPVANWLADRGITTFWAAKISITGFTLWVASEVIYSSRVQLAEGKSISATIFMVFVLLVFGVLLVFFIHLDEHGSQNIWARPRAFTLWWGSRLYMLVILGRDVVKLVLGYPNDSTTVPQDALYLFALYIWACRPRPPRRRRAPEPTAASTERAT